MCGTKCNRITPRRQNAATTTAQRAHRLSVHQHIQAQRLLGANGKPNLCGHALAVRVQAAQRKSVDGGGGRGGGWGVQ